MPDDKLSPRLSPAAVLSLILGLTGPPGLVVGYLTLHQINASDGRLRGRYLAYLGIGLGAITSAALLAGAFAIVINQMRVVSGRAECANNLRQIGGAVQKYHMDHDKTYPAGTNGPKEMEPERRLSYFATLLPYMEQRPGTNVKYADVAAKLDFHEPWDADANQTARQTTIPSYACRDDTGLLPDVKGTTNYVGITGIGPDAARLPKDSPRAGFFGYDRTVGDADIKAGTSYLVILTETTMDNGPWVAAGRPTLRDVPPDDASYLGPGRPFGGLHHGGANVLHVDGSVLLLNDAINAEVFRSLMPLRRDVPDAIEPP
jgi:hypothetical protein